MAIEIEIIGKTHRILTQNKENKVYLMIITAVHQHLIVLGLKLTTEFPNRALIYFMENRLSKTQYN